MSDPRIPRISEQARDARRLWRNVGEQADYQNASHAPIHRDPGEVRPAKIVRSVKVRDKLPDAVEETLAAFGDTRFSYSKALDMARLSLAKAIRDAEERMLDRAAKVCDAKADVMQQNFAATMNDEWLELKSCYETAATAIRSLPLEHAP